MPKTTAVVTFQRAATASRAAGWLFGGKYAREGKKRRVMKNEHMNIIIEKSRANSTIGIYIGMGLVFHIGTYWCPNGESEVLKLRLVSEGAGNKT